MIFSSHKLEYGALGFVKGKLQYPTLYAKNNDHFSSAGLLTDHDRELDPKRIPLN